jgi:septum formation protein
MKKIILATASPYRQEAFKMLGIDFEAAASKIDEDFPGRPSDPQELVKELARRKAEFVAKNYTDALVVGFDSVGCFESEILEKPKNKEEAKRRLLKMSGKEFKFYTGICLLDAANNKKYQDISVTRVAMRELSDLEIERYLAQDQNFNTYALGFDPLGHASMAFVEKIEGSYNNLLRGIPVEKIVIMLKKAGANI